MHSASKPSPSVHDSDGESGARIEPEPTREFLDSLSQGLWSSVAALRASLESMAADLDEPDPRSGKLHGVLHAIHRLSRRIDTLVDYARPRILVPMRCTAREVVHGALSGLSTQDRERVRLELNGEPIAVRTDAPVLGRCLLYLLEAALDRSTGEVHCSVREKAGRLRISVVEPAQPESLAAPVRESARRACMQWILAARELERMGGRLRIVSDAAGGRCAVVVLDTIRDGEETR